MQNTSNKIPGFAIKVENISKTFKIPGEKYNTLRSFFYNFYKSRYYKSFVALQDINFEVKKGEWLGIIGRNGSGKSTLLKIIAGIYQADVGRIIKAGSLVPFLELGIGFNPDLSARENIYLNGTILGITKKEIDQQFDKIVDFAEINNFLEVPMKDFSSGMKVRLAFSIAICAQASIYLLDEVLAVGDFGFKQKCRIVFRDMKNKGKTVLFVSHAMDTIRKYCDRVLWIDEAKIKALGDPVRITKKYINQQL